MRSAVDDLFGSDESEDEAFDNNPVGNNPFTAAAAARAFNRQNFPRAANRQNFHFRDEAEDEDEDEEGGGMDWEDLALLQNSMGSSSSSSSVSASASPPSPRSGVWAPGDLIATLTLPVGLRGGGGVLSFAVLAGKGAFGNKE
jgi:hypothetical protein